ncbi:YheC/YheD family protein [Heyndrickxia faecalis]|uniref:YheC/YheD family endospore coat-associated protein n=1 Tax=Heyndrickxia faecalis TaxID=2824910 RepID=UPI0031015556
MTVIWFDRKEKMFKRTTPSPLFWGKEAELIPFSAKLGEETPHRLMLKGASAGPLIGILISKSKKAISGDRDFFIAIQQALQEKQGGLSFLFSLADISAHITGVFWDVKQEKWHRAMFPLPDVVYNRIRKREEESGEDFHRFTTLLQQKRIPFFNPHFLNKYDVYEKLKQDPAIAGFLPETALISDEDSLHAFLLTHKDVYIKPAARSQGYGIRRIVKGPCETWTFYTPKSRLSASFSDVWQEIGLLAEKETYIVQETVPTLLLDGRKYDYRVHVHYDGTGYRVTSIGVRVARPGGMTTHTAKGGETLVLSSREKTEIEKKLAPLISACGNALAESYGFFGEFTADIAPGNEDSFYLFELNAKPMSFDEPEIETAKTQKLADLFYAVTGFLAK